MLCLVGVWYVVTEKLMLVNPLFLPSPVAVVDAFRVLMRDGFIGDIWMTIFRVMSAFVGSVALAVPVALFLSESSVFRRFTIPYIDFVRYIPVPALIPIMILFFGIGEESKIVLLFIGTFFQVVLLFDADILNIPKEYFDLAYSLRFTQWQRVRMKAQATMPDMCDNMRISLGLCWSYVVIAELVSAQSGIGHMIKEAQRFSHTAEVFVGILVMGAIGFFSDYLFRQGNRRFFPYKK